MSFKRSETFGKSWNSRKLREVSSKGSTQHPRKVSFKEVWKAHRPWMVSCDEAWEAQMIWDASFEILSIRHQFLYRLNDQSNAVHGFAFVLNVSGLDVF